MQRKNKKFKKLYLLPIIFGVIFLIIASLGISREKRIFASQIDNIVKNEAVIVSQSLKGIIQSQIHMGRIDKNRLSYQLDSVLETTSVKYVKIENSVDKTVYEKGISPSGFTYKCNNKSADCGYDKSIFYYWTTVNLGEKPFPPPPSSKKNKRLIEAFDKEINLFPSNFYDFRGSTQKIIVGIDAKPFITQLHEENHKVLVTYLISCIAIIIFVLAWLYAIKNSKLKFELETEKNRSERLEELGLAAAGLAHEIKNPLGIIRGLGQKIVKTEKLDLIAEMAGKIIDESDITAERLSDFMNYAKHRHIKLEEIQLKSDLSDIIKLFEYDFEDKGIIFQASIEDIVILADREFLHQILINILLNSLKASQKNQMVKLSFFCEHGLGIFKVTDTGCGISKEIKDQLFKPYVSGFANGHGIGLAIVKKYVDELNWAISVTSDVGVGTEVVIKGIKIIGI